MLVKSTIHRVESYASNVLIWDQFPKADENFVSEASSSEKFCNSLTRFREPYFSGPDASKPFLIC
uniref:Uncharacterized protein n=1 Tax=Romanomermis culicivorax TaxID=13658 RepID=A0A915L8M2_ROMCU